MTDDQFYQKQYFDTLSKQIADLQGSVVGLEDKIDDIKSKVIYMYGFAAAVGLAGSYLWSVISTKIFGH